MCVASFPKEDGLGAVFSQQFKADWMWGSFRPQLFFGVRAAHSKSPLFGLHWTSAASRRLRYDMHHHASRPRSFGWMWHNGRSGEQFIDDSDDLGVVLRTLLLAGPDAPPTARWVRMCGLAVAHSGRSLASTPPWSLWMLPDSTGLRVPLTTRRSRHRKSCVGVALGALTTSRRRTVSPLCS